MKINTKTLQKIIREELAVQTIAADADTPELPEPTAEQEEAEVFGDGGSARMARSQLFRVSKFAQSLHDKLNDNDKLPEWIQAKIAAMVDDIDEIHGHLDHKMATHDEEESQSDDSQGIAPIIDLIANLQSD